jgi:hypothetical protein
VVPRPEPLDLLAGMDALGLGAAPVAAIAWGWAREALLRDRAPALLAGERHRPRLDGAAVDRLVIRQDIRELSEDLNDLLLGLVVVHPLSHPPVFL